MVVKADLKQICKYLDEVKWQYLLLEEENLILTGWRARVSHYRCSMPVEIKLTKHWIVIQGVALRRVAVEQQYSLLILLSSLNERCRQARYFISNNRVLLQTEVSLLRCSDNLFWEALENVCRNFSAAGPEISIVATNPSVANLLKKAMTEQSSESQQADSDEDIRLEKFNFVINQLRTT